MKEKTLLYQTRKSSHWYSSAYFVMVYDVILASSCGNQVVTSNAAVNSFIKLKKHDLHEGKCARVHISKSKCGDCPELLVNGKPIKESHSENIWETLLQLVQTLLPPFKIGKEKDMES